MQLKITVAVSLVLTLLVMVPGARADPIRGPAQYWFDDWFGNPWVLGNVRDAPHWDRMQMDGQEEESSAGSPIGPQKALVADDETSLLKPGKLTQPETEEAGREKSTFSGPFISAGAGPDSVPEPSALALMGVGLLAIGIFGRRRLMA